MRNKEFKEITDRNELVIHVVGTSASGKSAIQLIIAEALKDKGFNVKINSSDHESEDGYVDGIHARFAQHARGCGSS